MKLTHFILNFVSDSATSRATIGRAMLNEGIFVRSEGTSMTVVINGVDRVRIKAEPGIDNTVVTIQQIGMGMIDGQESMKLMESSKRSEKETIFGG